MDLIQIERKKVNPMVIEWCLAIALCVDIFLNLWILAKQYVEDFNLKGCKRGSCGEDGRDE